MGKTVTMCFIIKDNKVLMVNRNKPPFMGLWNVLGGKAEKGETAEECIVREIKEESGINIKAPELLSEFTWNYDDDNNYAFTYYLNDTFDISAYPVNTEEGILDFKDIDWVLNGKNFGVVPDLRIFFEDIKNNRKVNYHLIYDDAKLVEVIKKD